MNGLSLKKLLVLSLIVFLTATGGAIQAYGGTGNREPQKSASKNPDRQKKGKIKRPGSAKKAQKKQAANDRKLKKDYEEFVKENRKRSVEIQTPEVRERMKQNVKNANASYKVKKKTNASRTRKAGRKYR